MYLEFRKKINLDLILELILLYYVSRASIFVCVYITERFIQKSLCIVKANMTMNKK